MDLLRARIALRERSLLDILDLAVRFWIDNAGSYARLSIVTIAPALAISWAAAKLGGWLLGWPVAFALAVVVDAAFVALSSRLVFADEARVRDVVRSTAAAAPRVAVVRCAQGIALVLSMLLLGLPWLWLGSVLLFLPEVVVLERPNLGAAWGRAHRIANAQLGVAMAATILLAVLLVGGALVADVAGREALDSILEVRPEPPILHEGVSALALVGFWSVLPVRAITRFFVYLDIRTRTEGWDIQTRFAALAARLVAETPLRSSPPASSEAAS